MRRKDREVLDFEKISDVMNQCDTCRLGLSWEGQAYIVPLCFGYRKEGDQLTLYFHSAPEGHKLDLIRKNPNVAFEMDCAHKLFRGSTACGYGMRYSSVMGTGSACLLTDLEEKTAAFECIMAHYATEWPPYHPQYLQTAAVIAVTVTSLSCKINAEV